MWPFLYPDSEWDFRLEQVRSINVSGHKYGLVYPGIGWLVFRERSDLAEDLVFYENYLGKSDTTFTLNFSTGSAWCSRSTTTSSATATTATATSWRRCRPTPARWPSGSRDIGEFELVGDEGAEQLPLVAFQLAGEHDYDEFDVASQLAAERGWMLPAYTLPPNAEHVTIMRALVKRTLGHTLATTLADDIAEACETLEEEGRPARARPQAGEDRHRGTESSRLRRIPKRSTSSRGGARGQTRSE